MSHKIVAIVLVLAALLLSSALAEADLAGMSADALYDLRDAINLELASRAQSGESLAAWETSMARVELIETHTGTNPLGEPSVALTLTYTNLNSEIDRFNGHFYIKVFQDGIQLSNTTGAGDYTISNTSTEVMPGITLTPVILPLKLNSDSPTIDVMLEDRSGAFTAMEMYTIELQ